MQVGGKREWKQNLFASLETETKLRDIINDLKFSPNPRKETHKNLSIEASRQQGQGRGKRGEEEEREGER